MSRAVLFAPSTAARVTRWPLRALVLACLVAWAGAAGAADGGAPADAGVVAVDAGAPPVMPPLDPSVLGALPANAELDRRRATLAEALAEVPEGADADPQRNSLKTRLRLIDEVIGAREAIAELDTELAGREARERGIAADEAALDSMPTPTLPARVGAAELERIEARAEALRQAVDALEAERAQTEARLDALPAEAQAQRAREQSAEERTRDLREELRLTSAGDEQIQLEAELEAARLEAHAASITAQQLDRTVQQLRSGEGLLRRRIELARRRLRRQEQVVEHARDLYERSLAAERADTSRALADARRALEGATTDAEQLMARGRVLLSESRVNVAEAARLRVVLDRSLTHQRKLLGAEKAEFKGLTRLVERDTSGRSAATLKDVFQRLDRRYAELRRARSMDGLDGLSDLRSRRLEVAAQVYALDDRWQIDIDALPDREARTAARALREELRFTLRAEQEAIADALASGEALQAVLGDRDSVLEELDALVRSRIFWVQDKAPLGTAVLEEARQETVRLGRLFVAPATWRLVDRSDAWPPGLLAVVASVGGLLLLLAWWRLRRWLGRAWPARVAAIERGRAERARDEAAAEAQVVAEARMGQSERPTAEEDAAEAAERARAAASAARAAEARAAVAEDNARASTDAPAPTPAPSAPAVERPAPPDPPPAGGPKALAGLRLVLLGALAVILLPLLLYGLARLVEVAPVTDVVRHPTSAALDILALLALLLFSTRLLLRPTGLAPVELGLAADTTATLRRATRTGLLVALPTLVIYSGLSAAPLQFEGWPRLCYSALEVVVLVLLLRVLRPRSPVVRDLIGQLDGAPPRGTGLAWGALALFGVVVVGMDLGGYRYGSNWLAGNAIGSLTVFGAGLLAWPTVRERLAPAVARLFESADDLRAIALRRARRIMRVAFLLAGVLALAFIWDIDRRALGFLDAVTLYTIGAGDAASPVTLADLARVLVAAAVVFGVLRWLPGLLGLTLFRYIDVEAGARYAIVTIARYVVLIIGVVIAVDALHIDLDQLGWLVAAIGVGLGFGLQEIVANFVSGIILLMERPIRIGDWITIGSTEGTVQRIKIRATTLLTLDRQEIIVPNKDFITREVINWTHQDRVVRLTVPIGVAYGTDVERMRRLLLDIAAREPRVLDDPPPNALLMAHGDSSLDFELRVHHLDPTRQAPLRGALNAAINVALAEAGIEIPFPQRDLHLRSGWPPSEPEKPPPEPSE